MPSKTLFLVCVMWLLFCGAAYAQEATDAVEQVKEEETFPTGLKYGSPGTFVDIHGFFEWEFYDYQADGALSGVSTMDWSHFYISNRANLAENQFIFFEIEYEHGTESELEVARSFYEWTQGKFFNLKLGQFFLPFGMDREVAKQAPLQKFAVDPAPDREYLGGGYLFAQGVTINNSYNVNLIPGSENGALSYDLSIFNGFNTFESNRYATGGSRDNNTSKALAVRLGLTLFDTPNGGKPEIGLSKIFKHRYDNDNYASKTNRSANEDSLEVEMLAAHFRYQLKGLEIRSQWMGRSADDQPKTSKTPFIEGDADGFYFEVAYKVVPYLIKDNPSWVKYFEPVVRYSRFDNSVSKASSGTTPGDEITRLEYGIRYSPADHVNIKAMFLQDDEKDNEVDNDGFIFEVVVDF